MYAEVTCEKCGKPLGVFDGKICSECEKSEMLDKIIAEIASLKNKMLNDNPKEVSAYIRLSDVREIIDKYR